ncbi:MAG TPA: ATP-binding protein [Candidatus Sulfopaludibacter sp.]|jgi:two-component system sensor histidine kinase CpxA|nr:ATP-binding protein [Candidatus Sulfopaludibacter sp.]
MRTLFAKILLWFWCTLAITVVGSAFISALGVNRNDSDTEAPASRLVAFQLEEARSAYETGGRPALQTFLDTLHQVYKAQGVLTDEHGRDVLTGQDRSDLVRRATRAPAMPFIRVGEATVARHADDGRYWFFFITPRPNVGPWFLTPDHLFVMGAAILLCYWLAFHLTDPVRSLQKAVERFGRGDLSARVGSTRRDELGQLARTFDRMAGRIETLLAAERRLLLDISHELRSPLARLGVAIELARSGENLDSALNRIQKESDRLNTLVGQLLQVTRAEGDPSLLRRDPLPLDELVQELVDESGIEAAAHGCHLKYEKRAPALVQGDPELLRRAIENVIRNAIRYSPPQSTVEVSLARRNGSAIVDVRDEGPGVPEEALPRLFDAFYRVDGDRNRASGGIGLGLSIARRALELHKGAIRARNAHPGLEVELEIPVAG